MILKSRGVIPFQRARMPSSRAITVHACTMLVYFGSLPGKTTCFWRRVFTTSNFVERMEKTLWELEYTKEKPQETRGTHWIVDYRPDTQCKRQAREKLMSATESRHAAYKNAIKVVPNGPTPPERPPRTNDCQWCKFSVFCQSVTAFFAALYLWKDE